MASIRKRNGRYQAQVRRRGYSPASRTYTNLTAANKWIRSVEVDLERSEYMPRVTLPKVLSPNVPKPRQNKAHKGLHPFD